MRRTILRILLLLIGGVALTLITMSFIAKPAPPYPFFANNDGFLVIAHQGGNLVRPDNTMTAFEHAVSLGVDVLEMDVHSSADGELVIIHDDTVDRTTNGSGRVNEMTLAQLKALDAAWNWTPDGIRPESDSFPYRGQGITIPTLAEVLQAFPDVPLNIEIKQTTPSIAAPLCEMLRAFEKTDQVLIASFRQTAIEEFRAVCPEVATAMVEDEIRIFFGLHKLFLSGLFQPPGTAFQVPEYYTLPTVGEVRVISSRFVRDAQRRNIHVSVWTVNTEADMERMLDAGVHSIITDRPDLLLALLEKRGE